MSKKHDDEAPLILDDIKLTHSEMLKQGGSHDEFLLNTLNALEMYAYQ